MYFVMRFGLGALLLATQGCAIMAPPSQAKISLHESTITAEGPYNFDLEFETKGDTEEGAQTLSYSGEGENPWRLVVGQDVQGMTSPATLAGVEGLTAALPVVMGIAGLLLQPVPDAPPGPNGVPSTLLDLLLRARAGSGLP